MNYEFLLKKNIQEFSRHSQDRFSEIKSYASTPLWHMLDILGQLDEMQFDRMAKSLPEYGLQVFGQDCSPESLMARKELIDHAERDIVYLYKAAHWKRCLQHMDFVDKNKRKKTSQILFEYALSSLMDGLASIPNLKATRDYEELGIDVAYIAGEYQITHCFFLKPFEVKSHVIIKLKDGTMPRYGYNYFGALGIGPTEFYFHNKDDWDNVEKQICYILRYMQNLFLAI
jgi:hypothetical protein